MSLADYFENVKGFGVLATADDKDAVKSFKNALAVEKVHHRLYKEALQALESGKDVPAASIYVCQVCGNTVVGRNPDACSVCGSPQSKFKEVR